MPRDAKIGGVFVSLRAQDAEFVRAMRRAGQQIRNTENHMRGLTTVTTRYANAARTALATFASYLSVFAAFGAIQIAARNIADFERELAKIRGLVGVSAEGVDQLAESILRISQTTGTLPEELARAAFFITSAGLRGATAAEALAASARASVAGLGETQIVADAVTSAMNAYGEANLDAATAVGTLTATVRLGKAEADSIAPVLGRITGAAAELGVSFQQLGAGLSFLTGQGLSASEASIGLNAVLKLLVKPSEQALQVMAQYGLELSDMREILSGSDTGLLDLLTFLKDRLDAIDLGKLFRDFNAVNVVLQITGQNTDRAREIFQDMADSGVADLEEAFRRVEQTLSGQFNIAIARASVLVQRLGDQAIPSLTEAIREFNASFNEIRDALTLLVQFLTSLLIVNTVLAAIRGLVVGVQRLSAAWRASRLELSGVGGQIARVQSQINSLTNTAIRRNVEGVRTLSRTFRTEQRNIIKEIDTTIRSIRQSGRDINVETVQRVVNDVISRSRTFAEISRQEAVIAQVASSRILGRQLNQLIQAGDYRVGRYALAGVLTAAFREGAFDFEGQIRDEYSQLIDDVLSIQEDYHSAIANGGFSLISDQLEQRAAAEIINLNNALVDINAEIAVARERLLEGGFRTQSGRVNRDQPTRQEVLDRIASLQDERDAISIALEENTQFYETLTAERLEAAAALEELNEQERSRAAEVAATELERIERTLNDLRKQAEIQEAEAIVRALSAGETDLAIARLQAEGRVLERINQEYNRVQFDLQVARGEHGQQPDESRVRALEARVQQLNELRNRGGQFNELAALQRQANLTNILSQNIDSQAQQTENLNRQRVKSIELLNRELQYERAKLSASGNQRALVALEAEFSVSGRLADLKERLRDLDEDRQTAAVLNNTLISAAINDEIEGVERLIELLAEEVELRRELIEEQRETSFIQSITHDSVEALRNVIRTVDSAMENFLTSAIVNFDSLSDAARQFGRVLLQEVVRQLIASPIASAVALGINSIFSTGPAGGLQVDFANISPIDQAAEGGLKRGLTLVGEGGAEIVDFQTPSRVYTTEELSQALRGGGQASVYNFSPVINSSGGDENRIRAIMLQMFPLWRQTITNDIKTKLSRTGEFRDGLQYGRT